MSCVPRDRSFRLLDALVGWDVADSQGIVGLDDIAGLRLAGVATGAPPRAAVDRLIPPARLARGCDACTWYLVTPAPPESRLLTLGACDDCWQPLDIPLPLVDAVAVTVHRFHIAIADRVAERIWIVTSNGRIVGEASTAAVALAFTPDRELVAARDGMPRLVSFDLGGRPLSQRFPPLPVAVGNVDRIAFGLDCAIWLVMRACDGVLSLWRAGRDASVFERATLDAMTAAFAPVPVMRVGRRGFCLDRGTTEPRVACWSWQGRCIDAARVARDEPTTGVYARQGQLLTRALDSGAPRCRWHRLRVDVDVPAGTGFEISLSTSEAATPAAQGGINPRPWDTFASGVPHPDDWQTLTSPADDVLIRQPPGRYLFVRVRLVGDGTATPVLRRLHLDLPRVTSADQLPAIYRTEPDASDFTERFMALFDATLAELDEAVQRAPALLDAGGVPDGLLSWIARILGMAIDPGLPAARRRALLKAAAGLFRRRGTPSALIDAIRLTTDLDAIIEEPGLARAWAAVAANTAARPDAARLGRVRVFGQSDARLRLGASRLNRATLHSYGNPDVDSHHAGAFRVVVSVPAIDDATLRRIRYLVEDMVPAHVVTDVAPGHDNGFWLRPTAKLAVDTRLGGTPAPVLGEARVRLNRTTLLPVRNSRGGTFAPGHTVGCGKC